MIKDLQKIPAGWKKVKLGEVLNYEQPTNYIVKSENYDKQTGIPVLTAGKSLILGYTDEKEGIFKDTPVIIFDDFTTESKFINFPFKVKSSALKILKLRNSENNIYFLYNLLQILNFNPGSEHKRYWISEYSNIIAFLPPLPEQEKIAEILETVDNAIGKTDKIIEKYKRMKQGLMQELLTKGIDSNWQIRSKKTHQFKDSPLGRIPADWEVKKLGEISKKILSGATPLRANTNFWNPAEIPWLTNEEVEDGKINYVDETKEKVSKIVLKRTNLSLIPSNSVILSLTASVGKIAINMIPLTTNQQFNSFVLDNQKVIPKFLAFYLLFVKDEIISLGGLTTFNFISKDKIADFEVSLPPLPEQEKIAEILETVDNAIEKTDKIIEKYKRMKQGLMQELLTKGIDNNWQIRSEKTHKFKDSPLGRIPADWEVKKLGEIGEITMGQSPSSSLVNKVGNGVAFLQGNAEFTTKYPNPINWIEKPLKVANIGSILMSVRAPIGALNIADRQYCIGRGLASISVNKSISDFLFIWYFIQFHIDDLIKLGQGSTFEAIGSKELYNLPVILPPLPEQERIASVLSQVDAVIEKETAYRDKLSRIKQGLMEDLLTGKVRVTSILENENNQYQKEEI